jgi:hypothetical protein
MNSTASPASPLAIRELLVIVGLFALTNVLGALYQEPIEINQGRGWDGVHYAKMTEDFDAGRKLAAKVPFVYRPAVPWLASLAPGEEIVRRFRLVNVVANVLSLVLFWIWLRPYVGRASIRILLATLFIVSFNALTRRVYFSPVLADYWDKVWLFAGLIAIREAKTWPRVTSLALLSTISFFGVWVREVLLLIPVAFLFADNPLRRAPGRRFGFRITPPAPSSFLPLLAGALALFLVRMSVEPSQSGYFLEAITRWVGHKQLHDVLYAWFITYGPILVIPLFDWRSSARFLARHQYLLVYLVAFSLLAWVGGSATYRLLYWTCPVVFLLVGRSLDRRTALFATPLFAFTMALSWVISQRVFWPLPQATLPTEAPPTFLTPLGPDAFLFDVIGMGSHEVGLIALAQYLVLSAGLLLYLWRRSLALRATV